MQHAVHLVHVMRPGAAAVAVQRAEHLPAVVDVLVQDRALHVRVQEALQDALGVGALAQHLPAAEAALLGDGGGGAVAARRLLLDHRLIVVDVDHGAPGRHLLPVEGEGLAAVVAAHHDVAQEVVAHELVLHARAPHAEVRRAVEHADAAAAAAGGSFHIFRSASAVDALSVSICLERGLSRCWGSY